VLSVPTCLGLHSRLLQTAAAMTSDPESAYLHFLLHAEAVGYVTVHTVMDTGQASSSSPP
jgi:hypothetical protein